ncbi:hypothetical protein [Sediminibacterium ginsengisoli]|uniref:Uncharacterized protein n=1 Tax=Sediminibacterium ginsengisoli TaxID=413434 RepID=A0A1T4PAK4_9BACT|nr:hypothetical protein [Sediminibacterium ginsengisoli]SJZ88499.1 hypothetical protein SAMN04488132_105241 [Sediminibacterium ginsengisoli]
MEIYKTDPGPKQDETAAPETIDRPEKEEGERHGELDSDIAEHELLPDTDRIEEK